MALKIYDSMRVSEWKRLPLSGHLNKVTCFPIPIELMSNLLPLRVLNPLLPAA